MSMYFTEIDISKYKYDCCIIPTTNQQIVSNFTVRNNKDVFEHLLTALSSLSNPEDIKTVFKSTAHYALNLELFLENAHYNFMKVKLFTDLYQFLYKEIGSIEVEITKLI